MKINHLRAVALSALALAATAPAALALDANDFATKLTTAYVNAFGAGEKVTLGTATVNGNDITYDGATVTLPGDSTPTKIATKLQFTNVVEAADGSYTADSLSFPDVDYKYEGGEISARNMALQHLYITADAKPGVFVASRLFAGASAGPIVLTVKGQPALTLDSVAVTNTFKPSQTAPTLDEIDSTGTTTGLKFDPSRSGDPDTVAQAKALGIDTVTGKGLETVSWTLKDGHLDISEISLDLDQIGKLKLGLDLTGYTPQLIETLKTASQTLLDSSAANSSAQATQTASLLQAVQTLFLNGASIRFDDASITGGLLDYYAKQGNVSRAALIDQIVTSMPDMDKGSSDPTPPAVMKMMQASVRAYLNDPHSIELRVAPKGPLGVLGIVAAAMQPDNLAEAIGLEVLVNDKQITAADAAKETGSAPASDDQSGSDGSDGGEDSSGN